MSKKDSTYHAFSHLEPEATVPWASTGDWRSANGAIQHLCALHHPSLGPVRKMVRDLKGALETIFPALESLCLQTCPGCRTPCCHVATVWFDFKDLIFINLVGAAIPLTQLGRKRSGPCRLCTPSGCSLPRLSRPWICTWYLCPPQKILLHEMTAEAGRRIEKALMEIKALRNRIEDDFIRITCGNRSFQHVQ